jgi:fluoroquinolone transport system ATP-binding protein
MPFMSFDIHDGEVFGFLGPSGAGKTTTQRLIIGLLRNYNGKIEVLGKERNQWGKDFYEQIGVAFDFPNLYTKLTVKENLQNRFSHYPQYDGCRTALRQGGFYR